MRVNRVVINTLIAGIILGIGIMLLFNMVVESKGAERKAFADQLLGQQLIANNPSDLDSLVVFVKDVKGAYTLYKRGDSFIGLETYTSDYQFGPKIFWNDQGEITDFAMKANRPYGSTFSCLNPEKDASIMFGKPFMEEEDLLVDKNRVIFTNWSDPSLAVNQRAIQECLADSVYLPIFDEKRQKAFRQLYAKLKKLQQ